VPALVVAALSARMLAQSAQRAGWDVVALDLFGDVDTRAAAMQWHAIGDPASLHIDGDRLLAALDAARKSAPCLGWVAGAGFEPHPELLEAGAHVLPLLGNDWATFDRVRDPRQFFATLTEFGIAHPETQFDAPPDRDGWLIKDFAASGGWHIHHAAVTPKRAAGARAYFQRAIAGRPMSVLFIGIGGRARPIGINELLVRPHGARPYVYHGAVGPVTDLPRALAGELIRIADVLVQAFNLRGLGSLDVLVHDDTFSLLEVNPRPSSTLGLYDADVATGLVKMHVDACFGAVLHAVPAVDSIRMRGELIVFARSGVIVTSSQVEQLAAFGCHDLPQPQSPIASGAPLCSVSAQGKDLAGVRATLAQHEARALSMVQNRNEAHDHAR